MLLRLVYCVQGFVINASVAYSGVWEIFIIGPSVSLVFIARV